MAFNYNRGANIAQGINYTPISNPGTSISGVIQGLKDGNEWKQQQEMKAWLQRAGESYAAGDDAGFRENMGKADPRFLPKYDQNLANRNFDNDFRNRQLSIQERRLAQDAAGGGLFGSNNETVRMMAIASSQDATPEQKKWATDRLSVLTKDPMSLYSQSMATAQGRGAGTLEYAQPIEEAKMLGKESAKKQMKDIADADASQLRVSAISDMRDMIKNNPQAVGWQSPYTAMAGRVTDGAIGMSKDDLRRRGELVRGLGEIQNELLAKARASGQTGINTMAEIRQATKGIDENSSPEEILGALDRLEAAEMKLQKSFMSGNASPYTPQSAPVDDEQTVDFTEYFK